MGNSAQTPASAARVTRDRLAWAVSTTIRRSACRRQQLGTQRDPVVGSELDVHDRQVRRQVVDEVACGRGIVRLTDALDVGQPVEREHQEVAKGPVVVHHQNALHACSVVRPRLFAILQSP